MENFHGYTSLILASASRQRRELLEQVTDIPFEIIVPVIDERVFFVDKPPERAVFLAAQTKAASTALEYPLSLVIGADTVAVHQGAVIGKPDDDDDARAMLRLLRNGSHTVLTGLTVIGCGEITSEVVTTEVRMRDYSDDEIEAYVRSGEPMGKAGAYAIQGKGALLVDSVSGCYSNVVGLPLARLGEIMLTYGVSLFADTI